MCEKLAQSLAHLTCVEERELFDFGARGGDTAPVVLLLDRRDDPVTPLLLQWTFQAMVHELIGISTNRVDMRHVPGVRTQRYACPWFFSHRPLKLRFADCVIGMLPFGCPSLREPGVKRCDVVHAGGLRR